MASLNLVPHPPAMIASIALFLANLWVVKMLIVVPYMRLRELRESLTTGSESLAKEFEQESAGIAETIDERLADARRRAAEIRSQLISAGENEKAEILATARQSLDASLESAREEIEQQMAQERQRIPATVDALTKQVYDRCFAS